MASYLHALTPPPSGPLVAVRGLGTEEASLYEPPSGTRLQADSVP